MKFINRLTALIGVLAAACLVLPGLVSAAPVLSLETKDAAGNPKSGFVPGEVLRLVILVDDPTPVAGAAFTIGYDQDAVIPPTTVDGIADPTEDVVGTAFPFTFVKDNVTTKTHRENSETDQGKLYLSGAAINEATGGPKPVAAVETALFIIKFTVKPGVAAGTPFNFSLTQTELMNEAAGYGNDVNDDGIFDEGVDTKEKVPVLVGAVDNQDENWDDLNLAFPVLLSHDTDPAFAPPTPADCTIKDQNADDDNDGMLDYWEQQIVNANPNDGITTMEQVLAAADFDGDGATNKREHDKGTDPTDPNSRPVTAMPSIPLLLLGD